MYLITRVLQARFEKIWLFSGVKMMETSAESGNSLEFCTAKVQISTSLGLDNHFIAQLTWEGVQRVVRLILYASNSLPASWIHLGIGQGGLGVHDLVEMVYCD